MEYDAIVVGGGLAGLTCTAYLCKYGIKTLLVEKGKNTGGLVNTFQHEGFTFDSGIRAFENSGILFPMLKNLDIDIKFTKNPVSIGIESQWTLLDSGDSLQDYASMLKMLFPNNLADIEHIIDEIKKVMGYMDVLYGIDNPLFIEDINDLKYITKTLLPWLLRYQVNIRKASSLNEPIHTYLKRFTDNESLIDIISQHFFTNTPTYFALSYFSLYMDYCYPMGGTGVLSQKLTEYIQNAGGKIFTETSAIQVDPQTHKIFLSDGQTVNYKKLVWAADQKTLYSIVTEANTPKVERQRMLASHCNGGDSILTLFMGINLDRNYFSSRCGAHSFYTPIAEGVTSLPDWHKAAKNGNDALLDWVGSYLERTTYEISCPVIRDESLAPQGKTGIIVSTLMDYGLVQLFSAASEYERFKQYCIKKITKILETSLFTGLREKTIFTLCATPLTIERETGNAQGAITGWAFTNTKIPAENRLRKIANSVKTPIDDIYQCGQWTFSPSGLPVSILTGKLASDAILKTLKGKRHDTNHY